jgi:hypothetical protein
MRWNQRCLAAVDVLVQRGVALVVVDLDERVGTRRADPRFDLVGVPGLGEAERDERCRAADAS